MLVLVIIAIAVFIIISGMRKVSKWNNGRDTEIEGRSSIHNLNKEVAWEPPGTGLLKTINSFIV